jgi:hypothetical protein
MAPPTLDELISTVRGQAPDDAIAQLRAAASLKGELDDLTDALLGHFVDQARRSGATWSQIGDALGVTKQAAQQRHTSTESAARRILGWLAPRAASTGFRRFTPRAKSVVVAAEEAAVGFGDTEIGSQHLLVGLYAEPESIAVLVLDDLGVDRAAVTAAALERSAGNDEPVRGHVPFGEGAKQALEHALRAALDLGHNYVGTEHILLGVLRLGADDPGAAILVGAGVTEAAATERIVRRLLRH